MIDLEEFQGFVEKVDEKKSLSEQQVKNQFDNHDTNERQNLDKVEFGVALHSVLLLLKSDIENGMGGDGQDEDEDDN